MTAAANIAWLARFKLGPAVDKTASTHHDAFFSYYQVSSPSSLRDLSLRVFQNFDSYFCFTLSEHAAKEKRRFFLDIDVNKKPEEPKYDVEQVMFFVRILQEFLRKRISSGLEVEAQWGKFDPKDDGAIWKWVWNSEKAADGWKRVDPFTAVLMNSVVDPNEANPVHPFSTWHIVWPFVTVSTGRAMHLLKEFVENYEPAKMSPILKYVDAQCVGRGTLRGFMCDTLDKQEKNLPGGRPFKFGFFVDSLGNLLGHDILEFLGLTPSTNGSYQELALKIWKATSLLYGRPEFSLPSPVDSVLPPPPILPIPASPTIDVSRNRRSPHDFEPPTVPKANDVDYSRFMATEAARVVKWYQKRWPYQKDEYNPEFCNHFIQKRYETTWEHLDKAEKGEVLNDLTDWACLYMNNFAAMIQFMTKSVVVVKHWRLWQSNKPEFVMKKLGDAHNVFRAGSDFCVKHKSWKKGECINAFSAWEKSKFCLKYDNITLVNPHTLRPQEFNLWLGFDMRNDEATAIWKDWNIVGPRTKKRVDLQMFLDHIYSFLCSKNPDVYNYVIKWLAMTLQYPFERKDSALVFISQEGIGKDLIFTNTLGKIMGQQHFLNTPDVNDIAGKFTGAIEGKFVVVFDEAFEVKGKKLQKLKSLITEKTMRVEKKGVDAYFVPNYVSIIINSNIQHANIFEVSSRARRYLMSFCDSSIAGCTDYFGDLVEWMGIGDSAKDDVCRGIRSVAYFLYNLDISDFNPRIIPHTKYMVLQKLATMPDVHLWWYECLVSGYVVPKVADSVPLGAPNEENINIQFTDDEQLVSKTSLYNQFIDWCHRQYKKPLPITSFFLRLRDVLAYETRRPRGPSQGSSRPRILTLPSLKACRESFKHFYRGMTFEEDISNLNATASVESMFQPAPHWGAAPSISLSTSSTSPIPITLDDDGDEHMTSDGEK